MDAEEYRTQTYVIAIRNWHPTRLNELLKVHWAKANRLKFFDQQMVGYAVRGAGVPKAEGRRRVQVEIVLGYRQRGGDVDAYQKSLLDALVACGALVDDSKEKCTLEPFTYSRAKVKATIITLTEQSVAVAMHTLKGRRTG